MKKYYFKFDQWQLDNFFSPIRTKENSISVLIDTVKLMLIDCEPEDEQVAGEIVLVVSKMSRLFYFTNDKYFSINFPFSVNENDDGTLSFFSKSKVIVDNKKISNIKEILINEKEFYSSNIYDFLEPIELISRDDSDFWKLLFELFLFEDGYIRYDHDKANENGAIHPLHHFDVFYSSNSTFKIGLRNKIEEDELIDLLEKETDCHFIG